MIFFGVWTPRFLQALHLTHGSIDVNKQEKFNLDGLYDIHIMSNKLNQLRRLTLGDCRNLSKRFKPGLDRFKCFLNQV
jgi:hypothetical protein